MQRFNPRAREGRDEVTRHHLNRAAGFNPRAREGRDTCSAIWRGLHSFVSIHAPARGATVLADGVPLAVESFNPRAREGRDLAFSISSSDISGFQSTRPRGARQCGAFHEKRALHVSIHAPARGATQGWWW